MSNPYSNTALSSTKAAAVAGPCELVGLTIYNPNAAVSYLQLFDAAAADVTVGTTTPTVVVGVPPNGRATFGPLSFGTAITVAATTTATGSSAPAAATVLALSYL